MKILILNHNQEFFGTYFRCKEIGVQLSRHGHQITMLCASGRNVDLLIRRIKINGRFDIVTLPRIKYSQFLTGQFLRLFLTLPYVLFKKYDLLYAFTVAQPQIGIPALIGKYLKNKRLFVDWDDLWGGGFASEHNLIINKVLSYFERVVPGGADQITCASLLLSEKAKKYTKNIPIEIIPNGCHANNLSKLSVRQARQRLHLPIEDSLIVSLGNTYTDSLGVLLASLKKAIIIKPKIKLVFVGQLTVPKKFMKSIELLEKNIIKVGSVPHSEVSTYLSAADSLVLPMDNNLIEKARFPMRFGDYLSSGKPIVSNAVGEVKRYMDKYKCGFVVKSNNVVEFSKALVKSISKSATNKRLGKNSFELAKNDLNWISIGNKLNEIVIRNV